MSAPFLLSIDTRSGIVNRYALNAPRPRTPVNVVRAPLEDGKAPPLGEYRHDFETFRQTGKL